MLFARPPRRANTAHAIEWPSPGTRAKTERRYRLTPTSELGHTWLTLPTTVKPEEWSSSSVDAETNCLPNVSKSVRRTLPAHDDINHAAVLKVVTQRDEQPTDCLQLARPSSTAPPDPALAASRACCRLC